MEERVLTLEVKCQGCGKQILTPAEAEMELFRFGIRVHNKYECLDVVYERYREEYGDYDAEA